MPFLLFKPLGSNQLQPTAPPNCVCQNVTLAFPIPLELLHTQCQCFIFPPQCCKPLEFHHSSDLLHVHNGKHNVSVHCFSCRSATAMQCQSLNAMHTLVHFSPSLPWLSIFIQKHAGSSIRPCPRTPFCSFSLQHALPAQHDKPHTREGLWSLWGVTFLVIFQQPIGLFCWNLWSLQFVTKAPEPNQLHTGSEVDQCWFCTEQALVKVRIFHCAIVTKSLFCLSHPAPPIVTCIFPLCHLCTVPWPCASVVSNDILQPLFVAATSPTCQPI